MNGDENKNNRNTIDVHNGKQVDVGGDDDDDEMGIKIQTTQLNFVLFDCL